MILSKDIYEYLLNFVDDKDVINMLSVNKKFCNDFLFEKELKRRYPLLSRFKKEKRWRDFYVSTIYYIEKLKSLGIHYIQIYDFNPESMYKRWKEAYYKEDIEIGMDVYYKEMTDRDFHTIGYKKKKNNRYKIEKRLYNGNSLSFAGVEDNYHNEIMIDFPGIDIKNGELWLAFEAENDLDESKLYSNKAEAVFALYNRYTFIINKFIDDILHNEFASDRQDALRFSNLVCGWNTFENFQLCVSSNEYPVIILYEGIPTMDSIRYDFALIQVYI